jgi:hypothetical protein
VCTMLHESHAHAREYDDMTVFLAMIPLDLTGKLRFGPACHVPCIRMRSLFTRISFALLPQYSNDIRFLDSIALLLIAVRQSVFAIDLARGGIAYCLNLPGTKDITDPDLCSLGAAAVCARLASSVGHCGSDGGADDGEHGEDVKLHCGTVAR